MNIKITPCLVKVYWSLKFYGRFSKNIQIQDLMKIRTVGAEWFHADGRMDGQTERHEDINNLFSQFCERA
jgi:hypothetical protein